MDDAVIHPALAEHHAPVLALLSASALPADGLEDWWDSTLVASTRDRVVGSSALELWGDAAVLRSVCVERGHRGRGLGERLVRAAIELAGERGVRAVYLLTETAEPFFTGFGFEVVGRDSAPPAIRDSVEFRSVCPDSATAMALRLSDRS